MPTLLICTVGGSPEPVVFSLLCEPLPDRVIFVCSQETAAAIDRPLGEVITEERPCPACGTPVHSCRPSGAILARLQAAGGCRPPQFEIVQLQNAEDLTSCVREINGKVTPALLAWVHGWADHAVVVDPTGGTKCMSVALALVARRWQCTFRYVGGGSRNKGGVGVVETGTERQAATVNPLHLLGYQVADDALTLCSSHEYAAAAALLRAAIKPIRSPEGKAPLETLCRLVEGFAAWDRFAHAQAAAHLKTAERNGARLDGFLDPACAESVRAALPGLCARAASLGAAPGASRELIEDLLANAARRRSENRHDDAVGRLYRAVEAMAQFQLADAWNVPDTGSVPLTLVPDALRSSIRGRKVNGRLELGLQDAYQLLYTLGDPLGKEFLKVGLAARHWVPGGGDSGKPGGGLLTQRNLSILAHGFQPVSPRVAPHP